MCLTEAAHEREARFWFVRWAILSTLIASLSVMPTANCMADKLVVLHHADASPRLNEIAEELFGKEYKELRAHCSTPDTIHDERGCPSSWRLATVEKDIAKGEGDLNDDGQREFFFVDEVSALCGTRGCRFTVVQQRGTGWRLLLQGSAGPLASSRIKGEYIRILDRTDFGYHRICSGFIYVWDGTTYQEIFPSETARAIDRPLHCE